MIITPNLLFITCCSSLLLILLLFLQTSQAYQMDPHHCSPSACGIIRNISSPFRLKDDPKHCGYPKYELVCEKNITLIDLNSQKFIVKEINYQNLTIRLVDVSINLNNTCSFPKYSAYGYNFSGYPYATIRSEPYFLESDPGYVGHPWHVNFMSCPYPLRNSSLFTETTHCTKGESGRRHTYIKVGPMYASDINHMCRLDLIVMTSWQFKDFNNVSLSEIHSSLLYGFELSWSWFRCRECNEQLKCPLNKGDSVTCSNGLLLKLSALWEEIKHSRQGPDGTFAAFLLFLLLILVVFFAGVSFPAKIIIGFLCVFGFYNAVMKGEVTWPSMHFRVIIGIFFALRFIIAFPFVMGLLIYKFRRRHLSIYDVIEAFLQSDNKLMPIRYSYSDIKRMTRGFREKLGQGGYGSVYKGKLRSGHYIAVKLLRNPKANGQDFMNEIATIGRIHHVNVVKLVGYCAERTKRALVFDFMPNGSLDKYIFNKEIMNSLNWGMKYEIAIGVARGIEYLHRGCDIQILHFDIKPHNILLDDKFIPKISDFGLAKFCSTEKNTVTLTAARGTIGYVAPELINRGIGSVSYKADIYSFGMLLMEMAGLNRDFTGNNENSSKYFPYWIYDYFDQGKDIEIGKTDDDDDNDGTREIARKMTIVALWCIQMSPDDRPSMNKVVEMLEGEVENLQIPHRASHSPQVAVSEDQTWSTYTTDSMSLLSHDAASSVEIIVEDLHSLQQQ